MSPHISRRYTRMVAAESLDDQLSAQVLLLDPVHSVQPPPRQPRRLQKPYPRPPAAPAITASPSFAPRPVTLPMPTDRPRSGIWPPEASPLHHHEYPHQRAKSVPQIGEGTIMIKTGETPRPWLRSNGTSTRDGKLVKAMGPGESRPITAVALPEDEDEDDAGGSWGRRRLQRLKGLLREKW